MAKTSVVGLWEHKQNGVLFEIHSTNFIIGDVTDLTANLFLYFAFCFILPYCC